MGIVVGLLEKRLQNRLSSSFHCSEVLVDA